MFHLLKNYGCLALNGDVVMSSLNLGFKQRKAATLLQSEQLSVVFLFVFKTLLPLQNALFGIVFSAIVNL